MQNSEGNDHLQNEDKSIFPYKIRNVESTLNNELMKHFTGEKSGFVQVGNDKWLLPSGYIKYAAKFYNFELRKDDVWIVTFPRTGTTWTQEMVWLLCNNLNYTKASQILLSHRFPFLEFCCCFHEDLKKEIINEHIDNKDIIQQIEMLSKPALISLSQTKERRFIKTHLPPSLLPPNLTKYGCKVIYLARNPKDVAVSYYHLNKTYRTQGFTGDFPTFWDYFERNLVTWTPYWQHVKEGWEMRNEENVHFMFYENMNKNLKASIENVATFLNKSLTATELNRLENHLKFENFKNNTSVNNCELKEMGITVSTDLVRKGQNGGWKDYFDQELERRANIWIDRNLKNTDMKFPL